MALRHDVATQTIKAIEDDASILAKQFVLDPSEAYDLLFQEIHHLKERARIQDFVSVLALKHVKARLRARPPKSVIYGLA